MAYVSQLALINARNLIEIIKWNEQNGFKVYRMSSDMIPWMSEYEIKDLPDYRKISTLLRGAGNLALKYGQRLSFHPGPFNVLGSPNPVLVQKTIKELNQHAEIMDLMGLPKSHLYPINIHCNGVYNSKTDTLSRWASNYLKLSDSAQARLVVENDDKGSMYSVKDLYDGIFQVVKVPITFDYHHHRINDGGLLLLGSTYNWNETFCAKQHWLGGYKDTQSGENVSSLETLHALLSKDFEPVGLPEELAFVLADNARCFQHQISQVTLWKKKLI
jgi:UV DNA damage endonuclease